MMSDSDKRILFVDDQVFKLFENQKQSTGGAAVQTSNWIKGFKSQGFSVKYTSARKSSEEALVCKYLNKGHRYFLWTFYLFNYYKTVKSFNPTIIYLSTAGWKTLLWAIIARLTKAQYIQRISNNIVFKEGVYKKKLGAFKYFLSRQGVKRANVILCQNSEQEFNIKKEFPAIKTEIVHNPYLFDSNSFKQHKKKEYVAWVGLYQNQKNLPALAQIVKQCKNINFKIAGRSTWDMNEETLKAEKELKTLSNVEFVGFLDRKDVKVFLLEALCLLNTSHYEGFSNTFLEAFASKTPVITRRATDPDGIIEKNDLGYVTDDYDEIPDMIKNLFKNGFHNTEYLIKYIKEAHDPGKLANKIFNILKEK